MFWSNGFANASVKAELSDGSVSPLTIFRDDGSGSGDYFTYDLEFAAGSAGQSLTLTVTTLGPNCFIGWLWVSSEAASGSTGTVATTNANDTSSASGTTTVTGTLSKTNANDTSSASGTTTVTGTSARTNNNDTSLASGATTIVGTITTTNVNDLINATGTAGTPTGTVNYTNNNDIANGQGNTPRVDTGAGSGGYAKKKKWTDEEVYSYLDGISSGFAKKAVKTLENAPKPVQKQVEKIVQPFIEDNQVDYLELESNVTKMARLIQLYEQEVVRQEKLRLEIEQDDEEFMMMIG